MVDDDLNVRGNASLTANLGSDVTTTDLFLGDGTAPVGDGTLIIDGVGSTLTVSTAAQLGRGGETGTLTVRNAATADFNGTLGLADNSASPFSTGVFNVQSGATVTTSNIRIAPNAINGQTGTLTVGNAVGTSTLTQDTNATLIIGASLAGPTPNSGTLNLNSGGVFNSGGGTGSITINPTGLLHINGGTLNANGNINVNGGEFHVAAVPGSTFAWLSGKTMLIQGGGLGNFDFGFNAQINSIVNVTGTSGPTASTLDVTGNLTVTNGSQLNISAGAMGLAAGVFVGTLNTGLLTVDGTGSSLTSAGSLTLANNTGGNGTLTLSNDAVASFGSILSLANFAISANAVVNVTSGAELSGSQMGLASNGVATATLNINGIGSTVTTTSGATTVGHSSSGSGTINLTAGGTFTTSSSLTSVNATGLVDINGGTLNLNSNAVIHGGEIKRQAGTLNWAASKTMDVQFGGRLTLTGDYTLPSNADINVIGGTSLLSVSGGYLEVTSGARLDVMSGGDVQVANVLHIGSGTVVVDGPGSTLTIDGASALTAWGGGTSASASVTLSNNATANVANVPNIVYLGAAPAGASTLNILSGADATMHALRIGNFSAGTGTVNLTGVGSTLSTFSLAIGAFSGAGTINASAGSTLTNSDFTDLQPTGTINITAATVALGTLMDNGGTINFNSGSLSYGGDLTVGNNGLLGENLTITSAHVLSLTGTTTVEAFRTLALTGGHLSTGQLVNNGAFDFQSGTLSITGGGGLTVGGGGALGASLTLGAGANVNVTNTATVDAGGSLTLDGGNFAAATLTSAGTVVVNGGAIAATTIDNQAAGRLFVGADAVLHTPATINNAGRIQLQGGAARLSGPQSLNNTGLITGDGEIAKTLTNGAAGEIRAEAGKTLLLSGPAITNNGKVNLIGGTAEFSNAVTNANLITGRGTLIAPSITNNGQMTFSAGFSDVQASLTNNGTGKVFVTGGGTSTFYAPVTLNSGSEFRVSTNSTAVFLDDVTGFGAGSFTGSGTKIFEAGMTNVSSIATLTGKTIVEAPATVFTGSIREASLTVNGAVKIAENGTAAGRSRVGFLDVPPGGVMNLNDNDLIVDYGDADPSPEFAIRDLVVAGLTSATGITTLSTPAGDTTLAVADAIEWGFSAFEGESIDDTTIVGKYTYYGDANLDGRVTSDDYVAVDVGLGVGNSWVQGDFNYSGTVTSDDYVAIDVNLGKGTPTPLAWAELKSEMIALHTAMFGAEYVAKLAQAEANGYGATLVPEPASLVVLSLGGAALLRRRRRAIVYR